jgi:hypothetical protein
VYIYLYARITDHINLDLSEGRLRRLLPMVDRYRKEHPEAHVCATILFSGAASQALMERNTRTHIQDFVLDYARRGVVELGYDGADEPTYKQRPVLDLFGGKTAEDRWLARSEVAEKLLTAGRDPVTGAPQPGTTGGLKEMQEVFGEAVCIAGVRMDFRFAGPGSAATLAIPEPSPAPGVRPEVGADSEIVRQIRRYNAKAIMFGLPDTNPARLPGFRGGEAGFSRLMSPVPEASPDLYWQDNALRSSESSDDVVRVVRAYEGPGAIENILNKADRSRIRILHVELASPQIYLQPGWAQGQTALQYAFDHPQRPKLPPDALRATLAVDAAYATEERLVKWLLEEIFPANPGSRFVSSTDLKQMTPPSTGFSVSVNGLRAALAGMLKKWGNDTFPPTYLLVDGRYLSIADMFQVMTDALAELDRKGQLPESVRVVPVYGPLQTTMSHGLNVGEVTVGSIAHVCAGIADALHDESWNPVPKNVIPPGVSIGDIRVNAAQFLRLMAAALVTPSPEAKLRVRMTYMFSGASQLFPKSRPMTEAGGTWTFKPAPLVADARAHSPND